MLAGVGLEGKGLFLRGLGIIKEIKRVGGGVGSGYLCCPLKKTG